MLSRCRNQLLTFALFLGASAVPKIASALDFKNYQVPLYNQIRNRIKAKILARVGNTPLAKDRYFFIPFAYEDNHNHSDESHSFMTMVTVLANHGHSIDRDRDGERDYDAFTISWLPISFRQNPPPPLCVFKGFGSFLDPYLNECENETGLNFTLKQTLNFAVKRPEFEPAKFSKTVTMWGPYEVKYPFFAIGVKRKHDLDHHITKYKADDRLTRGTLEAINCFHAIADLKVGFPLGGFLDTGFKMWGINGTRHNLDEYKKKAIQWFIDPIDIEHDLQAFVYVDKSNVSRNVKDSFKGSSAYYK